MERGKESRELVPLLSVFAQEPRHVHLVPSDKVDKTRRLFRS